MMAPFFIGMLAETPLHPGTGQSTGVVDLPVSREKTTGWPQIPETGLKGALKQWARDNAFPDQSDEELHPTVKHLFGLADLEEPQDAGQGNRIGGAGEVLITTARLLLLPVRRLDGPYAWVTTPGLIERLNRDLKRILASDECPTIPSPEVGTIRSGFHAGDRPEFLEEFPFKSAPLDTADETLVALLQNLAGAGSEPANRLSAQIAIMNDEDFAWYAANALPVNARNVLNQAKISENLWYEESLPVDTLLYAALPPRTTLIGDAERRYQELRKELESGSFLQIGGNETVGHGWVRVTPYPA